MTARVDVVIITWNDGALLDRAVGSVARSTGVTPNLIIVDNGSDPPAVEPADLPATLIRLPVNEGVAAGRNHGVRAGQAPFVCFLDSDAQLHEPALARLIEALEPSDVAMAVPVFANQQPAASAGLAPTINDKLRRAIGLTDAYRSPERPAEADQWDVDFGIGACQVFRRYAYERVGGLDERYFYGPEDVDFCLRLRRDGWRIVQVAGASVDHPARRRNRRVLTRSGLRHARALARHLWRHRFFSRRWSVD